MTSAVIAMWTITGIISTLTLTIAGVNIGLHLMNFKNYKIQFYYILIILISPIFSLTSISTLYHHENQIYVELIRKW
jgi:hypothetical protein